MTSGAGRGIVARYVFLVALRHVPTGLVATVLVLLLRHRGLSLGEIGIGIAAQGLVMLALELPSGGLADAVGRRSVILVAGVVNLVSLGVLLMTETVLMLAVVFAMQGVFRALDSGPLEAWYVDTLVARDPDVDVVRMLGRSEAAISVSVGVGALLGSVLVATDLVPGVDQLSEPIVLAMLVQAIGVVAVSALVDEHRDSRGVRFAMNAASEVPSIMRDALAIIRRHRLLAALVIAELLWGFGMIAFETMLPPRMAEVTDSAKEAATIVGPALTFAWIVSAVGGGLAPSLARRFGEGPTGCGLRVAHGLAVVGMAVAAGPAGLVAAYLSTYLVHGATNTIHYGMVHQEVEARHRTTMISANSLAAQLGGAVGGIGLGALADGAGLRWAIVAGAIALTGAAPLYLARRSTVRSRALRDRLTASGAAGHTLDADPAAPDNLGPGQPERGVEAISGGGTEAAGDAQ